MPELPEVETVVRTLRPGLIGRRITGVEMVSLSGNVRGNGRPGAALRQILATPAAEFSRALCGARVREVRRYGKNIVIELDSAGKAAAAVQPVLLIHLGMTGRLLWEDKPDPQRPHTHVIFALDGPGRWLHYSDTRRFGKLRIISMTTAPATKGRATPADPIPRLGPDPLEITSAEFCRRLHTRRAMVKAVLLDQGFLRGLGNIYADESLFRAGIHPAAAAARLSSGRAARLHAAIQETLAAAIELGGSSVSNYLNADGRAGWFQQEHRVYRRTGQPCARCGAAIRRIVVAGRSTHFCPRCQPAPREHSISRRMAPVDRAVRPVRAARASKRGGPKSTPLPYGRGSESAGAA